jgi:hypothetical protein
MGAETETTFEEDVEALDESAQDDLKSVRDFIGAIPVGQFAQLANLTNLLGGMGEVAPPPQEDLEDRQAKMVGEADLWADFEEKFEEKK